MTFSHQLKGISFFTLCFFLNLTNCTAGNGFANPPIKNLHHQITSRTLSWNDPQLKTCVFNPLYNVVHLPMYHFPPLGHYTAEVAEQVTKSQFQLFHTIIDYNRSDINLFLFDENISSDNYNETLYKCLVEKRCSSSYTRPDGQQFSFSEKFKQAQFLFSNGIPGYYEHLSQAQKNFLFELGASFTLYLLQEITKLHKVISSEKLSLVESQLKNNPNGILDIEGNPYWVYDFRENELKNEVLNFLSINSYPQGIVLIAYGANHDFSDNFSNSGLRFQSGHDFCLTWTNDL